MVQLLFRLVHGATRGKGTTAAQNTAFASGRTFDSLLMDQGAFWRSGETADSEGVTFREAPLAYAAEKPAPAVFKALKAPPPAYQPRTWRIWTGQTATGLGTASWLDTHLPVMSGCTQLRTLTGCNNFRSRASRPGTNRSWG